ncbi:hypothetical protein [Arthrobacter nitrophenolicus]|uniref:Uncharacterized protein n=1 Tax=Arthrobacter nitrophenolicus TaxID=683150 RepID=A0A4R5XZD8_9MICC|nr:hypothetical protein [Arthrobacter nitrophenolicus]TDL37349.1 hypothetical protein E2R57_11455 [Arthrobacter nitrophenolicus]
MATPSCIPEGTLRCYVSLRSILVCTLLVLLVAGAASYTHGSRYALVGHGPFLTAPAPPADSGLTLTEEPPLQATSPGQGAPPPSGLPAVPVSHQAGPLLDPESVERDCCERRQAPRGEPAPLRTGAVNVPSVLLWEAAGEVLYPVPSEPDLPALTVIQLSVSRT